MGNSSDKLRLVQRYVSNGWIPIPIPHGSKNPGFARWEQFTVPDDLSRAFGNGSNVGLLLGERSAGLVDVDLDAPEAVEIGPLYLPDTGMIHGRPSKPRSHWWYICDPVPANTRRRKDADGTGICELRSTGGQTVVPPSTHPDGEILTWESARKPARVDGRLLAGLVDRVAACALIARNWPGEGSRHDAALALAGTLLRNGWGVDEAVFFVRTAARVGGDPELDDRERAVRDTADNLRQDRPVTGIPTLKTILGEFVVNRLCDWLNLQNQSESTAYLDYDTGDDAAVDIVAPDPIDLTLGAGDWQTILEETPIVSTDLPYWFERLVAHLRPFTTMFEDDWPVMMALPFWAALWPSVRLQNLNLGIWALGLGVQGVGKNVATDELTWIVRQIAARERDRRITIYTAGTPEGMWEELAGDGKQMLCYHDEFGGFLKLLQRDHMQSARESLCSLYDGRMVGYLRSKKNTVEIVNPHVVVCATTTPAAIRQFGTMEDLSNGYLSRFLVCAPDARSVPPDYYPEDSEDRRQLINQVSSHLARYRSVLTVEWEESGRRDPSILLEYREHLGMNTGEVIDLDQAMDETTVPAGRLLARVKKIAALYELADATPQINQHGTTAYIRPEYVEAAIAVVERGHAYANRMANWIARSPDVDLSQRILRLLAFTPEGMTKREMCRLTRARSTDVQVALDLLAGAGQAISRRNGKTERWWMA